MVLDPGNMESDPLSQIQVHLGLWMLAYEVMGCFGKDESVLLELLHT